MRERFAFEREINLLLEVVEESQREREIPEDVADALGKKDWPLALKLAIQAGWRDENELTNLIFFARHPELPPGELNPKDPKFKQLKNERTKIRNSEVWKAIQVSQVLYVRPSPPKPWRIGSTEYIWSFDTAEGRREYEAALDKHLKDKKIVSSGTIYEPLSNSADIVKLASKKFAKLVLIVHSASDGPAIGVDLGSSAAGTKPDWIMDDKFADMIAPFGYTNITILGCDSVANKFTSNLAKRLPKGSTVVGHKGGNFEINRHFKPNKNVPGQLQLTRVSSNLQLKAFKTEGERARGLRPSHQPHSIGP